jgi:hypothetical protein
MKTCFEFDLYELELLIENGQSIELSNYFNEQVEFGVPIENKVLFYVSFVISMNILKCQFDVSLSIQLLNRD